MFSFLWQQTSFTNNSTVLWSLFHSLIIFLPFLYRDNSASCSFAYGITCHFLPVPKLPFCGSACNLDDCFAVCWSSHTWDFPSLCPVLHLWSGFYPLPFLGLVPHFAEVHIKVAS
jgi:hypothetical protein